MRNPKLIAIFLAAFAVMAQAAALSFDAIKYWVGSGTNKAALVVQWNDDKSPTALAWGYRWDGSKTAYDMIDDIAKTDPRFFYLSNGNSTLGGIGFAASGGDIKLNNGGACQSPVEGSIKILDPFFDDYVLCDGTNARWAAGMMSNGYWSFSCGDISDDEYVGYGSGFTIELENNGVQFLNYMPNFWCDDCELGSIAVVEDPSSGGEPPPPPPPDPLPGSGTQADPYRISTSEQLQGLKDSLSNTRQMNYYVLVNDIDLTNYLSGDGNNGGAGWIPIGSGAIANSFYGKLDGKGHKVSGLWINRPLSNYVGLFGYVNEGAEIKNIGVEINNDMGGVKGAQWTGGLIGYSNGGTISNSFATGNVSGTSYVGGLIGNNSAASNDSKISNSFAAGNVSGTDNIGGLAGCNCGTNPASSAYATISNSYAKGSVSGTGTNVGGLVGYNNGGNNGGDLAIISSSYYDKSANPSLSDPRNEGKSTAEMKIQATYKGWNFKGIWEIDTEKNSGYPILFWQIPNHIANAIITPVPNQTWTGNPLTPKIATISFNGTPIVEGTDFQYNYDNNIQTGTAALEIIGKGSYSGISSVEFQIIAAACGTGFDGVGTGTLANPYKILNAKNLDAIHNCLGSGGLSKHYELQNNIDLGSYLAGQSAGWEPIGNNTSSSYNFQGKFNGKGHKVSGLWINKSTSCVGLFGNAVDGAEIKNIGVEIDDDKGGVHGEGIGAIFVGGLAGYNKGTISNSFVKGNVSGTNYIGGLVGWSGSAISNSYATGSVTGSTQVGGLVGYQSVYGTISNSYATGSVTGSTKVGGLVGESDRGTIGNSYARGIITGSTQVGGLVGSGNASNSYYDKSVNPSLLDPRSEGKSTEDMKSRRTYTDMNWDFEGPASTWAIANNANNGYPILRWEFVEYAQVSPIQSYQPYTGSAIEPAFTIDFAGNQLTKDTDYEVVYSSNTAVGTAKITITGKDPYLGSIEILFSIAKFAQEVTQCNATLFNGGSGTQADPYRISTPEQLQNLNKCFGISNQDKYFVLVNDVDLTSYLSGEGNNDGDGWKPIGDALKVFYGNFDGNGYKVSGLWINRPDESQVGLFGYASHAQFRNVSVVIDNDKGGVKGDGYTGGLAGWNVNGSIRNSYVNGSVQGGENVGGLVGSVTLGTIRNCFATGNVRGKISVGGLAGVAGTILNSYATGNVQGSNKNVGGLVGTSVTVSNSYATGKVSGTGEYFGGLVGHSGDTEGIVSNSYYDSETSGQMDTGKGDGKSTANMKIKATYAGWDFEGIWEIKAEGSYPTLLWQNPGHIASAIADGIPIQTWTGSHITPKPSISLKGESLIAGADFEYAYDNNIQKGTATLKIIGKGSYSGQQANITEFTISVGNCGEGFAGGTGTAADPYQIKEAKHLEAIGNCLGFIPEHLGKYYELQNDIDLSEYLKGTSAGWQPIGSGPLYFSGKFNGNGYKVSGLWINRPLANYVGLFGSACMLGSEIRNIGVEINDDKGGVKGNSFVGSLAGYNYEPTISNSYAKGSVQGGGRYVGGLVGNNNGLESGIIINSFATGKVQGRVQVGGLVGQNYSSTISNSYATGNVDGNLVGGLVGTNSGTIINSYARGNVNGSSNGGLVGGNYSIISSSYYDSETSGQTDTGKGDGKSTAEMKTQATYKGWDFEGIWEINPESGYPTQLWQNSGHLANAIAGAVPSQIWTGGSITPTPSLKSNGTYLTAGKDFDYSYDNNIQIGTATLRIIGKGSRAGQAKAMEFSIIAASCGEGFASGNGTAANPYKISTAKNLDALGNCRGYTDNYYELQSDIDLGSYLKGTSLGWQPISSFSGKLNGNGYKVFGLWINRPLLEYAGLFGYVTTNGAEIKNIGVEINNDKGGVESYNYVGGLVGQNNLATISNSYVTGSVKGNNYVGGLVGDNYKGTIKNSYVAGSVSGKNEVGGLAGFSDGLINNSYYDSEASGKTDKGKGDGKSTAEMKTQATYKGWDFASIWKIDTEKNNGYPILRLQYNLVIAPSPPTPIFSNQETPAIGGIGVHATTNAILLSNLPSNAKVKVYNLHGKQIYSAYPENPQILRVLVQTKGMYIVKIGSQTMRVAVR
jgi:hypothetical protein